MLKIKDLTSKRKFNGRQDINFWDNLVIKQLVNMYKFFMDTHNTCLVASEKVDGE